MQFVSDIQHLGSFFCDYSDNQIKNEPMFFNANLEYCLKNGGIITHNFLRHLPQDWKDSNPVIDSRVHMLMPGWFPAIPGFHHDDVPRTTINKQPNYASPEYRSQHLTGLVNAEICPTLFALGSHQLPPIEDGIVYRQWHLLVEQQLQQHILTSYCIKSGQYIQFDDRTMHTATPAINSGWRWFIRLSRNTDRQKHITNEIRKQVQVYLEAPMDGW